MSIGVGAFSFPFGRRGGSSGGSSKISGGEAGGSSSFSGVGHSPISA